MIITALVLFCSSTLSADTPPTPATLSAIKLESSAPAESVEEAKPANPDAPTPKTMVSSASKTEPGFGSGVEPSTPASEPILNAPVVKPATTESYETSRQRKIWNGLMAASHGAAAFDAWTTRRAVSGGYGLEGDPLQRPFAHSDAIYATTQVTPVIMDYLGHHMMRSSHPWMRRVWWVPQAASASISLGAGVHNYRVVH